MTRDELSQVYYINREIEMWQRELGRLQCKSVIKSPPISGLPGTGGISDKTGELAAEIADCDTIIRGELIKLQLRRKRIMNFISTIGDSLIRQIIFYRNISCMTWDQVAAHVGGGNTADSVRMMYNRFLKDS